MPKGSPRRPSKNGKRTAGFSSPDGKKTAADYEYNCKAALQKKHMPKGDSCLFNSIYFLLNGTLDETGHVSQYMRQLVAGVIKQNANCYNKDLLGKSPASYCHWIQQETSWGGAVEISILADYYGLEIVVVDCTRSGEISIFGEEGCFSQRAFLLYNGTHYEPLYSCGRGSVQTIFHSDNQRVFAEAKRLGMKEGLKLEVVSRKADGGRRGLIFIKSVVILYIMIIYLYFSLYNNKTAIDLWRKYVGFKKG